MTRNSLHCSLIIEYVLGKFVSLLVEYGYKVEDPKSRLRFKTSYFAHIMSMSSKYNIILYIVLSTGCHARARINDIRSRNRHYDTIL